MNKAGDHCLSGSGDEELRQVSEQLRQSRLLNAMEKDELTDELLEECPEVAKAKTEVDRLEYRANILKQSIAECEAKYGKENKKPKASNSKTGTSGKEKKCNVSKEEDGKGKYV
uniref:Smoothelin domain-containing protein n=1 Tax=Syphacia muris TaxID=451379 RepID=A0A0N5AR47_9BILA